MSQESQDRLKKALFNCALYSFGMIIGAIMMYMYMATVYQTNCAEMLGLIR